MKREKYDTTKMFIAAEIVGAQKSATRTVMKLLFFSPLRYWLVSGDELSVIVGHFVWKWKVRSAEYMYE